MKLKTKWLWGILPILILLVVAGFASAESSTSARSADTQSVLQKVISSKKLTIGMVLSIPPQEYQGKHGEPVGMDVDWANLLAQSLGAKLKIVNVPEATRIAEIQAGKVDVLFSSPAITLERAQVVAFTNPYLAAGTVLVTTTKSGVKSAADMAGKKVGVLSGTFYDPIAAKYLPKAKVQHLQSTTDEQVALKNGQIAAYFRDSNTAVAVAAKDSSLKIITGNFGGVEYDGFAVQQGDQTWLNYLNTFIFTMQSDGTSVQLFKKWFGSPPLYSPILTKQLGS